MLFPMAQWVEKCAWVSLGGGGGGRRLQHRQGGRVPGVGDEKGGKRKRRALKREKSEG
jgi:hypothetical protein